jgi:ABC-type transport system involved in cytochrome c biogenesis permease subunit
MIMQTDNPYAPPAANITTEELIQERTYPGIGRLAFFLLYCGAYALLFFGVSVTAAYTASDLSLVILAAWIAIVITIAALRYRNIGSSGWMSLLILVPIISIGVFIYLLAYPKGYADHKRLDTAGKVIIILLVALILLGVIAAIVSG